MDYAVKVPTKIEVQGCVCSPEGPHPAAIVAKIRPFKQLLYRRCADSTLQTYLCEDAAGNG